MSTEPTIVLPSGEITQAPTTRPIYEPPALTETPETHSHPVGAYLHKPAETTWHLLTAHGVEIYAVEPDEGKLELARPQPPRAFHEERLDLVAPFDAVGAIDIHRRIHELWSQGVTDA